MINELRQALEYKILRAINEYESGEIVKITSEQKQFILTHAFIRVMNKINQGDDE